MRGGAPPLSRTSEGNPMRLVNLFSNVP